MQRGELPVPPLLQAEEVRADLEESEKDAAAERVANTALWEKLQAAGYRRSRTGAAVEAAQAGRDAALQVLGMHDCTLPPHTTAGRLRSDSRSGEGGLQKARRWYRQPPPRRTEGCAALRAGHAGAGAGVPGGRAGAGACG